MSKFLPQSRAYAELIEYARQLRELQTDAEQRLWMILRNRRFLGLKFRRQRPIPPYIVDFYCDELNLVIELDGGQHNTTESRRYDENRSRFLKNKGIDILRYWNHEVLGDLESVIEAIALHVDGVMKQSMATRCPHPDASHPPSPRGGRGLEYFWREEYPMFHIGSFNSNSCSGLSRRSFLTTASTAACALGLPELSFAQEIAPRAKSVVLVWLWGAPSHLDTFDPKPAAPMEYRGPFSTIATRTPGVRVTDLLPQLALRSDKYTLIRSHVSSQPGHPDAGTVAFTGFHERPEPVQPNFGSIVAKHRGQKGQLPSFISVGRGIPRDAARIVEGYGGGTLGKTYDPLQLHVAETGQVDVPDLQLLDGLSPNRIEDRQSLLTRLDEDRRRIDGLNVEEWSRTYQRALGLLSHPESRNAFDLTRETDAVRDRYGYTTFGQSCLLTRRLLEAEVPYIQLNWSQSVEALTPNFDFGWDTHIYNFELMQDRHCPILDRTLSYFIDELHDHGLLDTTLVIVMGEFGRTPRINNRSARDHWPRCYFSLWMGAGIPGGQLIGESDKLGEDPVTTPITPLMVGTTIAEFTGITTQTRAELNVLNGGTVIDELV